MSFVMGKQKPAKVEAPPPPVPLPTLDDQAVANLRKRSQLEMRKRKGRASTLLSGGPLGDQGASYSRPMLS